MEPHFNGPSQGWSYRVRGSGFKREPTASSKGASFRPFTHERDNAARSAWRNRLPHHDVFVLPIDFLSLVSSNPSTLLSHLDRIGRQTRTQIEFNDNDHAELLLWGDDPETKAAKDALVQWIGTMNRAATKLKASKSMPSVLAQTQKTYRRYESQLQELARQQAFKRDPDEGATFAVIGIYLWPLAPAQPQDMLGTSFEALDPTRMFHRCHIVYQQRAHAFKVFADGHEQARDAIEEIESAVLQFKASNSVPLEIYVVHPPETASAKRFVGISEDHNTLRLCGEGLTSLETKFWDDERLNIVRKNQLKMQIATIQALNRVCFHRGKVQIRVHFGVFTIHKLWREKAETAKLPIQQFFSEFNRYTLEASLEQLPATADSANNILARLSEASQLLSPYLAQTQRLEETAPIVQAIFTLKKLDGENSPTYETGEAFINDNSEVPKGHWSAAKSLPLHMYSIDLDGGVTWRMQISADSMDSCDRFRDPALKNFEVGFFPDISIRDTTGAARPIFEFPYSPLLESFTQKWSFRFRIKRNTNYVFECSIYDHFRAHDRKHVGTSWAATLRHQSWDEILMKNSSLRRGAKAEWKPEFEHFFPCASNVASRNQHAGFTELLDIAHDITEFLDSIKSPER